MFLTVKCDNGEVLSITFLGIARCTIGKIRTWIPAYLRRMSSQVFWINLQAGSGGIADA